MTPVAQARRIENRLRAGFQCIVEFAVLSVLMTGWAATLDSGKTR